MRRPQSDSISPDYIVSSHDARGRVFRIQQKIKMSVIIELCSSIIYGYYYNPILFFLPWIVTGIYGVWNFEKRLIYCFQLYVITNIGLRTYSAGEEEIIWIKLFFLMFVPFQYMTLYYCWLFTWTISLLNQADLDYLRIGWRPVDIW